MTEPSVWSKCKCLGRFMIKRRAIKLWQQQQQAKLKQETRKARLHNMKLPYDKNHAVNLCRKMLPALVLGCTGCECVFSSVCTCVCTCVCVLVYVCGRLMKCVRNSVRIVDRSGVHSRPLHTKLAHTHIHTRTRAFWKFDIFQFSLLLGQAACLPASLPACLPVCILWWQRQ